MHLSPPNEHRASGGGGNGGDDGWRTHREMIIHRLKELEAKRAEHDEKMLQLRQELSSLEVKFLTKLSSIDGKMDVITEKVGFLGFKAGIWAALMNGVAILSGLLLLYYKLK